MPDLKLNNIPGNGPLIYSKMGSGTRAAADLFNFQKDNTEVFSVDYLGLPDPGGNQAVFVSQFCVGDIVADADAFEHFLFEVRCSLTISAVDYCVDTDTADGTTNGQTLLIQDESANQIVSVATPTANPGVAAATWTTMGSVTNGALTTGDYLVFLPSKVSSGLAMSNLTFQVTYTVVL